MKTIIHILTYLTAVTLLLQISFFEISLGTSYYIILAVILVLVLVLGKDLRLNLLMLWLIFAGLLSILFNDIPIFFKPYQRFGAFLIVICLVGPFIKSTSLQQFRFILFHKLSNLIVFMVIISFLGIAAGLPSMIGRGGFAGLFNHSMMLGPMAAIAMLLTINWAYNSLNRYKALIYLCLSTIAFITCVAAGSRSALLSALAGGLFYFYKINRFQISRYFRVIMFIGATGILSFPLWESYTERIVGKMEYSENQGSLLTTRENLWTTRILEFQSSPIYGIGFSAVDTSITDKFDKEGTIEPGSSWLAVLSMVGLIGILPFVFLIWRNLKFIYKDRFNESNSAHIGALLILFFVHMMAEGYVFSAGSGMFFLFWLVMGIVEQTKSNHIIPKNI